MSCELGEDPKNPCPRDPKTTCVTVGTPLHWASPCLNYAIQVDGSMAQGIDGDQVQAIAEQAFLVWSTAPCPGGGSPNFQAHFQGFVSCDREEAVCGDASVNVNVVMFHDSGWTFGSSAIGVTTHTGSKESGLIINTDVQLDSQDWSFKSDATSSMRRASLLYTLAHEFGHFLGLAHSNVSGALMLPDYQSTSLSRNLLTADDAAAICAAYPPVASGALSLSCPATTPAYDACRYEAGAEPKCNLASLNQDASSCSCRLAANERQSGSTAFAALSVLLVTLVRRRRAPLAAGRSSKRCAYFSKT